MPYIIADIIQTPVRLFRAPVGTTEPALSLAADEDWPTPWVEIGYTLEPLEMEYSWDESETEVQQEDSPVKRRKQNESLTFSTVLAEHSAANLAFAFDGTATTTAATSTNYGVETLTLGGKPALSEYMFAYEGVYEDEDGELLWVRGYSWRVTASEGGTVTYDRTETTGIELNLKSLADRTKAKGQRLFKLVRALEPPTA